MKHKILGAAFAATLLASSSIASASEKVKIGAPAWTGAQAIAHLIAEVVETRIGGEAELVPGNNASIFQAMDQGKGDIDVHPDVWLPNQESFTKKYVDGAGTVALSQKPYEGRQSFCVSKEFSEKNNVTSIFDLARPEIASLMDSDGNGKGEIWIGAPGWASANVNEVKVRDYGLMPFMEPIRADQAVMTATVGDSVRKGIGYAFYCYAPHAIWYQFDIVPLSEPEYDPAKYIAIQPSDDPDWFNKSKVMTADALKKVQIAYSKSLIERSPAIAELLQNMQLDAEMVSEFAYQIEGGDDPADVVKTWVAENSERVDSWLGL
ncbi:glycine betaine ABC transporter substrate-binding protein [Kiloniella sp. EL199]|uniref:ABC transporter substrate-binding protein n=1 Tax=Kiloniella sp. EL199 TaxID=2107581 RepID=UPI000EA0F76D|nr:glycine betaine ABC transporter substrate-binding protein [Kiloniella sp. EL199]